MYSVGSCGLHCACTETSGVVYLPKLITQTAMIDSMFIAKYYR